MRNEEEFAERTLEALALQDYAGEWEVICVDDRSTDRTKEILEKFAATHPRFRVLSLPQDLPQIASPKKRALESAFKIAKNEVLLTMDADMATRDGLRMYGGQPGELEMMGGYDLRASVYHGRIAKEKIADNLTIGVNYMGVTYDEASIYEEEFRAQWINNGMSPVLLNTHVASVDVKGNVTSKLFLMADLGVSITDSTVFYRIHPLRRTGLSCTRDMRHLRLSGGQG